MKMKSKIGKLVEKCVRNPLEMLTNMYVIFVILIFPIMVDSTGFFRILEYKHKVFCIGSAIYFSLTTIIAIYKLIVDKKRIIKSIKCKRINIVQICVLAFLGINVISFLFTPYGRTLDNFIGTGRYEGLLTVMIYTMSFIYVSLFGNYNKNTLLLFGISSLLINGVMTLQFIGFNPFHMYFNGIGTFNVSYFGTIGNVDTVSAVQCIFVGVSLFALVFKEDLKKNEKIIHFISLFLGVWMLNVIDVESGKVGFIASIALAFPYIITSSKRFARFIQCTAVFIGACCFDLFLNVEYYIREARYAFNVQITPVVILMLIVLVGLIIVYKLFKDIKYDYSTNKKIIRSIYALYVVVAVIGIVFLYFVSLPITTLEQIHEMLHGHFEEDYGTYRVFLWKRAIKLVGESPIIGTGADTFAYRFMDRFAQDEIPITGTYSVEDTAANVYLTILVNLGIAGLGIYLLFIYKLLKAVFKTKNYDNKVLFFVIVTFLVQDIFNFCVIIVTPIFWVLCAIYLNSIKKEILLEKSIKIK